MGVLLCAACAFISLLATTSAIADSCGEFGRKCMRMSVPLDRSGGFPGSVSLRFEVASFGWRVGEVRQLPPLFVLAADAGESVTYDYPEQDIESLLDLPYGTERRVVVMDLRGTGRSGPLRCPSLQRPGAADLSAAATTCAQTLGPRRMFYTAVDAADDIEAVRKRLGMGRIQIYGASYGSHVAMAYARRYPGNVERMVLESVYGPEGPDVLGRSALGAAPRVLAAVCGKACRDFTPSASADLALLAERLREGPLRGVVTRPNGRPGPATIDGGGLFEVLRHLDFTELSFTAGLVPGAIRAALRGDPALLLRLRSSAPGAWDAGGPVNDFSAATMAAALCQDARLPWTASTPITQRHTAAGVFAASLPTAAFGPFDTATALEGDLLELCEGWPGSTRKQPAAAPLPDIPTLLLAGNFDLRTPIENAREVASALPRAETMVVRNVGHEVQPEHYYCETAAFNRFLLGRRAGDCPPRRRQIHPQAPPPTSLAEVRPIAPLRGRRGRTLAAVIKTVNDLIFSFATSSQVDARPGSRTVRTGALRRGAYVLQLRGRRLVWKLDRASYVPGVRVTGELGFPRRGPTRWKLQVAGPAAAAGVVVVHRRSVLTGRLGGLPFRVDLSKRATRASASLGPVAREGALRLPPSLSR